jgi:glycosyltransferase involved in cell wall biosynthesis
MIVQHTYPNDVRVTKEAKTLLSHGHRVSVIALRDAHELPCEDVEGVNVYRVALSKRRAGVGRYLLEYIAFFLYSFYKLNLLDLSERFDIVHINTLPDFLVFSALIQKLKGRKIILDMHEIMPEFFMSKFGVERTHPAVRLLLLLERASLKFADDVITVNEPIKRIFQSRAIPHKPIEVVMNTVSSSTLQVCAKRFHGGFNCVYHGTVTDIYGLDVAIEGFASVSRKHHDMVFHVFGDGPSLCHLKQLTIQLGVQKSVLFHGALPYYEMMDALAEMDLGILAIRKDEFLNLSFSNKLAEYVYLSIPVISSDLDTVKYYFDDKSILFFRAGDSCDLSSKMEYAYLHREQMKERAERAHRISESFDWDCMAKKYLALVEKDEWQHAGS